MMANRVGSLWTVACHLVAALLSMSAPAAGAEETRPDSFERARTCTFDVPLRNGQVLSADEKPLLAFGKLIALQGRSRTTLPMAEVATISDELRRRWEDCYAWKTLDSKAHLGTSVPDWSALVPDDWADGTDLVFVYVFWGWCEPCMVSLRKVMALLRPGNRVLIVALEESDPVWSRAFSKHNLAPSPTLHITYLSERPFQDLSRRLDRGQLLGLSLITDGRGCILHWNLSPLIASEVWKQVSATGERCRVGIGGAAAGDRQ